MLQAFANIFRIRDLRNKVFFTLGVLVIYRIGFWIPLLGVDQTELAKAASRASVDQSGFGRLLEYASIFSGGSLQQSTIFGLGIMPYITASIIFQLLQAVVPSLQELQKEGSLFLMWLGEQVDKYGIGNGVSIILTAGILSRMPSAATWIVKNFDASLQGGDAKIGVVGLLILLAGFLFVVGGAIIITVAQRRIPIQQAKHTRGRKVFGGQRHYLPLRINHAGVMPIIFSSTLMMFPASGCAWLASRAAAADASSTWSSITSFIAQNLQIGSYPYVVIEILLIYFFSYFWTTVQLSPTDMSKQLRDHGSFIPGLRPGPRTAEYLETVISRITYVGAGALALIAIIPTIVSEQLGIPFFVAQFLGGTGLLIVVSVALDLVQRIEANLLMRNYSGFLTTGTNDSGPRIRSARG